MNFQKWKCIIFIRHPWKEDKWLKYYYIMETKLYTVSVKLFTPSVCPLLNLYIIIIVSSSYIYTLGWFQPIDIKL